MLDFDYEEYEEQPRYRKSPKAKKEKHKKADHKHLYEKCVLSVKNPDRTYTHFKAKYCTVCGKVDCSWFDTVPEYKTAQYKSFVAQMWTKQVNL